MSCNLFHCFDPYVFMISVMPLKWMVLALFFFFTNWQLFSLFSSVDMVNKKVVGVMWNSFESLIKQINQSFLVIFSMIILIYIMNVIGLIPFMFTFTSHLSVNLSFSLSLWLSGVMVSIFKSLDGFFSHMVPTGTPLVLWVFLVLVESISLIIRPFTLSIRLMANVMAGHLIMNLFGIFICSSLNYFTLMFFQSMFIIFEHCISLVQSYVFVSLLSLYWDES
uniref:ATP synthase F0 subunit 6 n=1 Tax=Brueelia nebulosa TaxID=2972756 RepID=UPI0023AB0242|nr:ATP synthase F0 subunit 6 [Brueelia nebulosa]WCF77120.1 ATP synthase F0 subunit 6 [Brueelia nebulosa]